MSQHIGKTCPYCHTVIKPNISIKKCTACGIEHHLNCWEENGHKCAVYGCPGKSGDQLQNTEAQDSRTGKRRELFEAIEDGLVNKVVRLIERYGLEVETKEEKRKGETPLIKAICAGEPEIVQALISLGAEVNPKDSDRAPLLIAVGSGSKRYEIVKILIDNGANVNIKSSTGQSLLEISDGHMTFPYKPLKSRWTCFKISALLRKNGAKE